jgi:cell division septum initiation protein DivIVA
MLGASEKIALLSRQNEALVVSNRILENENNDLRKQVQSFNIEIAELKLWVMSGSTFAKAENHISSSKQTEVVTSAGQPECVPSLNVSNGSDYRGKILFFSREGLKELEKSMSKLKGDMDELMAESKMLHRETSFLNDEIQNLTEKKSAAIREIESVNNELSYEQSQLVLSGKADTSEPQQDTTAQLAYLKQQLQTAKKRKNTTQQLITTLLADRSMYTEEDIQGAQSMLAEINSKIDELERQCQFISTSPVKPKPQSPVKSDRLQNTISKAHTLDTKVSQWTDEINELSSKYSANKQKEDVCNEKLRHMENELSRTVKAIDCMKQIVLYTSQQTMDGSSINNLIPNSDAQWTLKDLSQKNAALTEELSKVRARFSSVLGVMDSFSLSNFKINSGREITSEEDKDGISTLHTNDTEVMEKNWTPNFMSSVNAWSRSANREIVYIISVRAVGSLADWSVSEWTVMRTFNEFKALRTKLKTISKLTDISIDL